MGRINFSSCYAALAFLAYLLRVVPYFYNNLEALELSVVTSSGV